MRLSSGAPLGHADHSMHHAPTFAAFALSSLLAAGCAPPPLSPRAPTPGVPHLRIATFNVNLDMSGDAATVDAIGQTGADIVCMQEITPAWQAAILNQYRIDYPYSLFHPINGSDGLAVISRFPLDDLGIIPGWDGWHPSWHLAAHTPMGVVQLVDVHLRPLASSQRDVGVVSQYLSSGQDHVVELRYATADVTPDTPTIVLGDFNDGPESGAVQLLEGRGYENALPLFHPGQDTWRSKSFLGQESDEVDHILFDASFRPLDAHIVRAGNSDHYPVVAFVEVAPP